LHGYLEKRGYNVLEAQDGEEALKLAECFPAIIHILVTDLIMVRMNGRELARRLMPLRPEMQVIMMSGFPDEILMQQELTPQIPILAKPFLPKRLLTAIEAVLGNPQSERSVASVAQSVRMPLYFGLAHYRLPTTG
jgi:DNA-binding response OmpR family regulator